MACELHQNFHMSTSCWWFAGFQTTDRVHWTYHVNFIKHIQWNYNYLQTQSMGIFLVQEGIYLFFFFFKKRTFVIICSNCPPIQKPFAVVWNQQMQRYLSSLYLSLFFPPFLARTQVAHVNVSPWVFGALTLWWRVLQNLVHLSVEQAWQKKKKAWGEGLLVRSKDGGIIFVSTPTMLHLCLQPYPRGPPT